MCDKRKIKNAASSLTSCALIWWKDLCDYEEVPQTWKNVKENEMFIVPCAISELSHDHAPTISEHEINHNEKVTTSMQGENSFDVSNLSTDYATLEQPLVEPFLDLPLPQVDF